MVESDPVADLMSRSASLVVGRPGTSRKRRVEKNNSIILGVELVVVREGSVTEEAIAETDGVKVQRSGVSSSEGVLHVGLFRGTQRDIVEPGGV